MVRMVQVRETGVGGEVRQGTGGKGIEPYRTL